MPRRQWQEPRVFRILDYVMRFSLQVHYAFCGMFDLAYNGRGKRVQVRVIGERQAIPMRYLEQIFQKLRRAELVHGKRGPGGGYVLARPAGEINLREVVEAVEGPIGGGCEVPTGDGTPDFVWPELSAQLAEVLAEWTLADVCQRAAEQGVRRFNAEPHNYQI
jgi:Rrf2 family protein